MIFKKRSRSNVLISGGSSSLKNKQEYSKVYLQYIQFKTRILHHSFSVNTFFPLVMFTVDAENMSGALGVRQEYLLDRMLVHHKAPYTNMHSLDVEFFFSTHKFLGCGIKPIWTAGEHVQ